MKAESNLKPSAAFEIETHGATATVILYDNVTKTTRRTDSGEETSYTFDRYTVETTARENLAEIVGANTTSWLEYAKERFGEEYSYYLDEDFTVKVDYPKEAGTYYMKACVPESKNYLYLEQIFCKKPVYNP